VATSGHDLALLAGLLDGSVVIDGLSVDTDLRWALLLRLVSRGTGADEAGFGVFGGFGSKDIDAELARDATDAGERNAATCRAAIPTAEAKRETWELLTAGEQTIAAFRATLGGFTDADQPELMKPYLAKYFEVIGTVWRDWSSAMAQDFVSDVYTVGAISAETVAATDAYIAAEQPPAALRRLLVEGRDDLLRALRCQARDRQAA
jgi:aminopeptidase N